MIGAIFTYSARIFLFYKKTLVYSIIMLASAILTPKLPNKMTRVVKLGKNMSLYSLSQLRTFSLRH